MNRDILRIRLAGVKSLLFVFLLYILKMVEIGMGWDFSRLGIYPLKTKGMLGVLTHPLIHSDFNHLLANTFPLLFLSWCLFYFYREIAGCIFVLIWIGSGVLTFLYGGIIWHMFPQFSPPNMSWEGHLSGGIAGMLCAFLFESNGPQRPDPFKDEQEDEEGTCYSETREEEPFL